MSLTWDGVIQLLTNTDTSKHFTDCSVSHEMLLEDLHYIKNIFTDKFLQGEPNFVSIHLSEMLASQDSWGFYAKQIHRLRMEITSLEKIPGFARLCRQLPTHHGYITQLEATFYINRFLPVTAIEYVANKQDIDIVCTIDSDEIFIHVKDLRQHRKRYNQTMAWVHLNNAMREMNIRNNEGDLLTVHFVEGYIPDNTSEDFWFNELKGISHEPGTHTVQIANERNGEIELIHFTTEWSPHGVAVGEFKGVDRFWLVKFKLAEVEEKIPKDSTHKNFLLGVAEFPKTFEIDRDFIEGTKMTGVFMMDWNLDSPGEKLLFQRSEIFCKTSESNIEQRLSTVLPQETAD